ncbi:DUF2530 domain-containing protein [Nocardia farcinica]|uniref:DUF2530 domain-containing protein n=1 Tax=Nocardia farcinica TaxID=37329 RepID=UPI0024538235|nr:DUF2530 domain-containing protein [Nocardia farcinica]
MTPNVPQIPPRLTDPRPVLAVGSLLWLVALVVVWVGGPRWEAARPVCVMGLVVGRVGGGVLVFKSPPPPRGGQGAPARGGARNRCRIYR